MPRLKTLPPLLKREAPRIKREDAEQMRDKRRYQEQPWRKWYNTKRWYQLRWLVLVRDEFTCQMCGLTEKDSSRLVCDHVVPHNGDEDMFWNGDLRTLCKPCHDGAKQREDKMARRFVVA